jgi:hypothetical protein
MTCIREPNGWCSTVSSPLCGPCAYTIHWASACGERRGNLVVLCIGDRETADDKIISILYDIIDHISAMLGNLSYLE